MAARTAEELFAEGYRVGAEADGFRVYRGKGGSYYLNCLTGTCECRHFRMYRSCSHKTELAGLIVLQQEWNSREFAAIAAQIRRGGLTMTDVFELTQQGQAIDDEQWGLGEQVGAMRMGLDVRVATRRIQEAREQLCSTGHNAPPVFIAPVWLGEDRHGDVAIPDPHGYFTPWGSERAAA